MMDKHFDAKTIEDKWYQAWIDRGLFHGDASVGSPECALINAAVAQMSTYYLLPSWVAGG